MKSFLNSPQIILFGLVALGVGTGVSYGLLQTQPPSVTPSPQPIVQTPPVTQTPVTQTPIATPEPIPTPDLTPPQPSEPPVVSSPVREIETCKMTQAKVNDPSSPLNVRSSPEVTSDNIVGQLEHGTWVTPLSERQGWLKIEEPVNGWIAANRTQRNCNLKVERISFAPGSTSTTVADHFIGGGSHQYKIQARQGQTITVTQEDGVFPVLTSPSGQNLVGDYGYSDNPETWTGQLPETGEYTLELISNYKGYKYAFSVKIN